MNRDVTPVTEGDPEGRIARWFELRRRKTTVGTELLAGVTTFLVMAYIIFVNPAILNFSAVKDLQPLGPGVAPTLAATCLVAGVMTVAMGLFTNYPFAVAPGMGLNAVVAFQLIVGMKLPWSAAMGVIVLEGLLITLLVLTGLREAVMNAIPLPLKRAIGVGIGLFILFIGLSTGGLVKPGPPGVPVTLGDVTSLPVLVTLAGLFLTIALVALRLRAALLLGILLTTGLAILVNAASGFLAFTLPGMAVIPSRILAWPDLSTFGRGLDFSVFQRVGILAGAMAVFSIMLADFFDTMGTVIGIAGKAGWLDGRGRLPGLYRILLVDSLAAAFGGLASASSATTYVESAAGVSMGGQSGLASVVTGLLFFLALFFAPLAGVVPPQATAPALILVGFLMCAIVSEIPFSDFEEGFPALLMLVTMPFTYSITNGFGAGFISYVFIKLVRGKARELHWMLVLTALAFLLYFALPWLRE